MGKTISRDPCPECKSTDNLVTWEYKGKRFTKCKTLECSYKKENHEDIKILFDSEPVKDSTEPMFLTGRYEDIRGISRKVCENIGIMVQGTNLIFQYKESQKVRIAKPDGKKDMYWIGKQSEAGLFGEHLDYDFNKSIFITEGEIDAASLIEQGYQAYSINSGAASAEKELTQKLSLINKFKNIYLWFDNDEAGKLAIKQVLNIEGLDLTKTHIVKMPKDSNAKDINDLLQSNPDLIDKYIKSAEEYMPEGLTYGSMIDFSQLEIAEEIGISVPFYQLQECYHGIRKGEILLIGAGSGAGKSLFSKHLVLHWMQQYPELRIGSIFLEEKQKFTLQSLIGLALKKPVHELVENPYKGLGEDARQLLGSPKYVFDNHFGSLQSKELFKKIRFLAKKTDVIILDHLSIVVSGMQGNDERKDIDRLMTNLKTIAVETGVRFVLISHLRRANGDATYEQGMPITSNSFRGSHSLYQLSDSVIGLERNQQDNSKQNMVTIRALKNRFRGKVGVLDELYYNEQTGCLTTLEQIFS
jgi:twinkle protein